MRSRKLGRDDSGSVITEFALIAPAFLLVVAGTFQAAMLGFTAAGMRYAVQAGARCASVNATTCPNSSSTESFTQSKFWGATLAAPTFTAETAACGQRVSGSLDYELNAGITKIEVPLTSTACFP